MVTAATMVSPSSTVPEGGRLVSIDGRALPLRATTLRTRAAGGIARTVLEQRFENPYAEPLSVTYSLPLPHDGAVSGFAFQIGDRRVVGEVDARAAARERFEQAVLAGKSASLLAQDRTSLFTQEIGNIPPGAAIVAEVTIDQKLRWLDEGAWEYRFPTVVGPRYLGAAGRVPDAHAISQDIADGPLPTAASLSLCIADAIAADQRVESPSHRLLCTKVDAGTEVQFGTEERVGLDRDVVVRWRVAGGTVGAQLAFARPARGDIGTFAYGLLTLVPPAPSRRPASVPRDLIVLIDTSGSMGGEPLEQGRRIVHALIDTLGERDQIEMIEFSNATRRWKGAAVPATASNRKDASRWLTGLRAGGGTEMHTAVLEALRPLRADSQRQIVIVTDGYIGFENEIVATLCTRLPASARFHTVGVGSAPNRSFTGASARAGRGIEVIVAPGEDPERAVQRILARTDAPVVVDLAIEGNAVVGHAPEKLPDLFAGAPALISLKVRPEGGSIEIRGRTADGPWQAHYQVPTVAAGEGDSAVTALFAREAVEDLEMQIAAGAEARTLDGHIESMGTTFQIATRLTSWVAVTDEPTVDPNAPHRRERMPHALAHGLSAEGVGLRAPMAAPQALARGRAMVFGAATRAAFPAAPSMAAPPPPSGAPLGAGAPPPPSFRAMKPAAEPPVTLEERTQLRDEGAVAMPPIVLHGRIARRSAREIVLEAPAPVTIDWTPAGAVLVTLADGTAVTATIVTEHTTRNGTLAPGMSFRLALAFASDVTKNVTSVRFTSGGREIVLEV